VVSHITDAVTTTDELIPSGETSSLRSNPLKLAEYTLSRKDPNYVGLAKKIKQLEAERIQGQTKQNALNYVRKILSICKLEEDLLPTAASLQDIGLGTTIFAIKPGDGSAREQAASCQKVLGGWANVAVDYATKRYRSNLINWGMLPLLIEEKLGLELKVGEVLLLPKIRTALTSAQKELKALLVNPKKSSVREISLRLAELTPTEREIILAGSLINYYQDQASKD
ncbi:MAG: hydratase, partial [Desulfovibrio sp.]|nr:hydratase [Desulfovibrio sp.]